MKTTDYIKKFEDNEWYNSVEACAGLRISKTTLWRKEKEGAIRARVRRHYPGKWYKGRDLNQFYNAVIGI